MIPADYTCAGCGVHGVKLWREYQTAAVHNSLSCGDCAAKSQGREVDLSEGDQIGWRVPAVPTLDPDAPWWGYTSVPAEGCAWWKALPLRLTGEWPVRGGVERWLPYREAMDATLFDRAKLLRVDFNREGGAVGMVFVAAGAQS